MATDDTAQDPLHVPPLEHTAFFDIDTRDGYVRIDQSWGDQTLYTPEEAREIAESIIEMADEAQDAE
ncbi:hypothetical protein ACFQMA_19660 [Halosimplex aquaticum]|uniref:Uncharacterized protein n=1 Tax=Halosimplex aquaticum TaxID=3026162 RepID=A0ABD5Y870_9EURY|nr:hypothetical protein [Halosimplex aquaticum]